MEDFTKKLIRDSTQSSFLFRRTYLAIMCWYSENKTDYFQIKDWIDTEYDKDFSLEIEYVNKVLNSNDRSEIAISRHLAKKIKYEFDKSKLTNVQAVSA